MSPLENLFCFKYEYVDSRVCINRNEGMCSGSLFLLSLSKLTSLGINTD